MTRPRAATGTMTAAVIEEFGGPDVLQTRDLPWPAPRAGWVRIHLRASALNWHDVLVRQGMYGSPLPHVIGADGAGIDAETGEEVIINPSMAWGASETAPGPKWRILGDHEWGTYAESVLVPKDCVVPKPKRLNWAQAAALPLVGLTSYRALFTRGRLSTGENLLILGATGGVATMALSLAVAAGANVWVTSGTSKGIEQAVERGARGGVCHADGEWPHHAKSNSPGGQGFDMVLDSVGRWSETLTVLRPGGRLVVLGASQAAQATLELRPFYFGQFDLLGTTMGSPRDLQNLLTFIDERRPSPPTVSRVFTLADAVAAHRYLESGEGFGKVVMSHV